MRMRKRVGSASVRVKDSGVIMCSALDIGKILMYIKNILILVIFTVLNRYITQILYLHVI